MALRDPFPSWFSVASTPVKLASRCQIDPLLAERQELDREFVGQRWLDSPVVHDWANQPPICASTPPC